jgi:hypothetical protein
MTTPPDGGPAFPCPHPILPDVGMSLRAYIATAALPTAHLICTNYGCTPHSDTIAKGAVDLAEALIAELNKPTK